MEYTIFETFVGAGGSHLGFCSLGFKSVYINDYDLNCINTITNNNKKLKETAYIDHKSILDIDTKSILSKIKMLPGELDVCFGGIVCKGFSLAGEKSPNDERNFFYHKQLELVSVLKPKISIIENVGGILKAKVLSPSTPQSYKEKVDKIWKEAANYKGEKANLRKTMNLSKDFDDYGQVIRNKKKTLLDELEKKGYLISVIDDIKSIYDSLGYTLNIKILNSSWYGSYTKRERVILVATRKDIKHNFDYPLPTHNNKNIKTKLDFVFPKNHKFLEPLTVNDALSIINYDDKEDIDNLPMKHSEKTVRRFKYIPEGESIAKHIDKLPEDLKISKFYSRGCTMRLDGNKPSPTLVPGHSNFPVHPKEHRSITVREAATITGFPTDYKFIGSHTSRCEQVGNAVPPMMSKAIAESCITFLDKYYK